MDAKGKEYIVQGCTLRGDRVECSGQDIRTLRILSVRCCVGEGSNPRIGGCSHAVGASGSCSEDAGNSSTLREVFPSEG